MTKSNHYVIGYDYLIAKNLRLKIEAYYQQLYNVPVQEMSDSLALHPESVEYKKRAAVSMLNYGADFYTPRFDSLVNKGTGRNYGLELTVEKFFSDGFYFLSTTSLFQSKYTTPYQTERNTVFNGNFVCNLLGGYEFKIGNGQVLAFDLKGVFAGGKRQMAIDLQKSIAAGTTEYNYDNIFSSRYKPYFRSDLRISYKMNKVKLSQEWAVDIQNITNHQNIYYEQFLFNQRDPQKSTIAYAYQIGFYPMVTYRLTF
jgi:outer membrane receptor protein involved in Fe transport